MSEKVRIAFNCPRQLLEEFDKAIEGKYGDRTAAILDGMRKVSSGIFQQTRLRKLCGRVGR